MNSNINQLSASQKQSPKWAIPGVRNPGNQKQIRSPKIRGLCLSVELLLLPPCWSQAGEHSHKVWVSHQGTVTAWTHKTTISRSKLHTPTPTRYLNKPTMQATRHRTPSTNAHTLAAPKLLSISVNQPVTSLSQAHLIRLSLRMTNHSRFLCHLHRSNRACKTSLHRATGQ